MTGIRVTGVEAVEDGAAVRAGLGSAFSVSSLFRGSVDVAVTLGLRGSCGTARGECGAAWFAADSAEAGSRGIVAPAPLRLRGSCGHGVGG